jgi:hypothetical protein
MNTSGHMMLFVLPKMNLSRGITSSRDFLKLTGAACTATLSSRTSLGLAAPRPTSQLPEVEAPDYVFRIGALSPTVKMTNPRSSNI